jgi:serine/threonine protein kinase
LFLSSNQVAYGGTPAFMAPELFLTNTTTDFTKNEGIDVFALGATLYFMLCGKPPWMAKNQLDLATKIKNIELTFPTTTIDPHVKVRFLGGDSVHLRQVWVTLVLAITNVGALIRCPIRGMLVAAVQCLM